MRETAFLVDKSSDGMRLDIFIAGRLTGVSRSGLKARLGTVLVNGLPAKASRRLRTGDEILFELEEERPPSYTAEDIPLDVLYEDEDVLVVNKAQGMVVHPGAGVGTGTFVQALLHHVHGLSGRFPTEVLRPGIVHRLDRETSGVLIAAKSAPVLEYLSRQFREKSVRKTYLALVVGRPPKIAGRVEGFLARDAHHRKRFTVLANGGRYACTDYRLLSARGMYGLVLLYPNTGRTHQLRVHLKSLGCPIVGDSVYGGLVRGLPQARLALHAYKLRIRLPDGREREFRAPLPAAFKELMRYCCAVRD